MDAVDRRRFQDARKTKDKRFDGMFYVAVKTTGIFCRPVCPATPPKEENVEYFLTREQSMASGYRPCLRCRPDSAPDSPAWKGVNTTIERAMKLLVEHPYEKLSSISSKLGITERYLHRLLTEKVGVSPKKFKLFNQVLNAKRLLHETSLSIQSIAEAVGFSSSRRLQAQLKTITGLTPTQLRRQNEYCPTMESRLFLRYRPPYDWQGVRHFLSARALVPIEQIDEQRYIRFVLTPNGHACKIVAVHQPEKSGFDVSIECESQRDLLHIISQLKRVLDLDADPMAIEKGLLASGLSSEHITYGLRVPGVWSPFEAGCRAIVGQQISIKAAINQLQAIIDSCDSTGATAFPTPMQIANIDDSILRMPSSRKRALKAFAQLFDDENEPSKDAILAIKGIGEWTFNYIALRGYSEPDAYLRSDLIVAKMQKHLAVKPEKASPWRSYLTMQLWANASLMVQ